MLRSIGSLWLTVTLLILLVAILLWGTTVEKYFGANAAKFGIYGSWWFNLLGLVLGLNSAASLALRWPWKRQQLGFTLPHLGLIVLLVGCFISRRYGIEATLTIIEGQTSDRAFQGAAQHVELDGAQRFTLQVESASSGVPQGEPIEVPFTSGPFNWDDFENGTLTAIPWSLATRDRGAIYNRDGIRLEVLDYLSNSEIVDLPCLTVEATSVAADGSPRAEPATFRLAAKTGVDSQTLPRRYGEGREEQTPSGARVLFWMSGNEAETAAFQQSAPKGPLGKQGRVVLFAKGQAYDWPLDDWQPGSRRKLGDSGLEVEFVDLVREEGDVLVRLVVHQGDSVQRMVLSSEFPENSDWQDYADAVFGAYWLARSEKPANEKPANEKPANEKPANEKPANEKPANEKPTKAMEAKQTTAAEGEKADKAAAKEKAAVSDKAVVKDEAAAKDEAANAKPPSDDPLANLPRVPPRIDFFQGADHELYLRTWRDGEVKVVGRLRLAEGGGRVTAFRGTPDAMGLKFSDFQPADEPGIAARALPFDKNNDSYHLRQAFVRLTVDGRSAEFWLPCSAYDPLEIRAFAIPRRLLQRTVVGNGRKVTVGLVPQSFQLGYSVRLNKAWAKTDPGARTKSFYASEIDLVPNMSPSELPPGATGPREYDNLLVTLNAPLDFTDPRSGKSFRMFQATMNGPFKPQQLDIKMGDPVYVSGLSLNDDPGRGLTYVGCLLVVAGIFVAYFVKFVAPKRCAKLIPNLQSQI